MKKGEEERVSHLIDRVKILIEKFLMLYMTKEETAKALLDLDKISPTTTEQVWKHLEEENIEFFQHYHARLLLKDNIIAFNDLLRKQADLMAAGGPSRVAPMQVSEGHQSINSGGDASALHGSTNIPTIKWASENSETRMLHDVKGISVVSGLNSQGNPDILFFQDGNPMRTQARQTIGDALGASYPPFKTTEQQCAQQFIDSESSVHSVPNKNAFFQHGNLLRTQAQQTVGGAPGASFVLFTIEQQYVRAPTDANTFSHAVPNQNVITFDVSNQRSAGPDYVVCPTTTSSSVIRSLPPNEQQSGTAALCPPENETRPLNRRGMQNSILQFLQEAERGENCFKHSYPNTSRVAFPTVDNQSKTQSLVEDAPIPSLQCFEHFGTELHEPNRSVKRLKKPFTGTWKNLPKKPSLSTSRNVSPSPNSTDCAPILSRADHMPRIQNPHDTIADVQPSRHENTPSDVRTPPVAMVDTASESLKAGTPDPEEHPSNTPIAFNTDTDPPGTDSPNDDPLKFFDVEISGLDSPLTLSDLDGISFSEFFSDDDFSSSIPPQAFQNGNIFDGSFNDKPI